MYEKLLSLLQGSATIVSWDFPAVGHVPVYGSRVHSKGPMNAWTIAQAIISKHLCHPPARAGRLDLDASDSIGFVIRNLDKSAFVEICHKVSQPLEHQAPSMCYDVQSA